MRALIFMSFAAVLAIAAAAKAPTPSVPTLFAPTQADRAAFRACLDKGPPKACIGVIEAGCMTAPGSETTAGSSACFAREEALWRENVDAQVAALRTQSSPWQAAALTKAQAAWETWRLAKCGYDASEFEGGSLSIVVSAACLRDESAARAVDLARRLAGPEQ